MCTLEGRRVVAHDLNSGNEIGPFKAIEESTLAHLVEGNARSDIFAWYVISGTVGMASGTSACGWLVQHLQSLPSWRKIDSYRTVFWMYSGLGLVKALLSALLSKHCEPLGMIDGLGSERDTAVPLLEGPHATQDRNSTAGAREKQHRWFKISKSNWLTLFKICLLFAVNSLASGMVTLWAFLLL